MIKFKDYYIFDQISKNNQFDHIKCLNDLMNEVNPILLNDTPSFYWNGVYKTYTSKSFFSVLYAMGPEDLFAIERMKTAVSNYFLACKDDLQKIYTENELIVPFKNIALNVSTGELMEYSKDVYVKHKLPIVYNPEVDISRAKEIINNWSNGNASIALLLEEIIGSCLVQSIDLQQGFILLGPQNNGKSTFIEMLEKLVGNNNCSFLELKHFTDEKYVIQLADKLINCGDDIDNSKLKDTSALKKAITHNMVTGRHLYDDSVTFRPLCTCIFSANTPPEIIDDTGAIKRRITYVPFENDFSQGNKSRINGFDKLIKSPELLQAFAIIGIDALKRLQRQNYQYTKVNAFNENIGFSKSNEFYLNEFIQTQSQDDFIGRLPQEKFGEFLLWTNKNHNVDLQIALPTFSKFVTRKFDLKTKSARPSGKVERVFCKKFENVKDLRINEEKCGQHTNHAVELKEIKYGN